MGAGPGEALDGRVELVAAVEVPGEAGEVARRVLRADAPVGADDRGLDVAQHRVDPLERRPARGLGTRAGAHRAVLAAGLRHGGPAREAVADDRAAGGEAALGELLDLLLPEALDHLEAEPARLALGRGLHRRHERDLAGRAPAPLAARPPPAEVGVVDLDPAFEPRLRGLALSHDLHQLVLHQPGRALAHAEPAAELDPADAALALAEVVERHEPGRERQLGVGEDGPRRQADLMLAAVALECGPRPQRRGPLVTAGRAGPAPAPAQLEQGPPAPLLGAL